MGFFAIGPSVVPSFGNNVNFFPIVLADVSSPELICSWVKSESPRITKAEGEDLWMITGFIKKGIIGRETIGTVTSSGVHVDSEDLTVVNKGVLRKTLKVVCFSAITDQPPFAPVQRRLQSPPAKSKFLAVAHGCNP